MIVNTALLYSIQRHHFYILLGVNIEEQTLVPGLENACLTNDIREFNFPCTKYDFKVLYWLVLFEHVLIITKILLA